MASGPSQDVGEHARGRTLAVGAADAGDRHASLVIGDPCRRWTPRRVDAEILEIYEPYRRAVKVGRHPAVLVVHGKPVALVVITDRFDADEPGDDQGEREGGEPSQRSANEGPGQVAAKAPRPHDDRRPPTRRLQQS